MHEYYRMKQVVGELCKALAQALGEGKHDIAEQSP